MERRDCLREHEEALAGQDSRSLDLKLFVAGLSPRSRRAISRIRRLCDEDLDGRCELTIIDIFEQPALAKAEQIVAVPVLIKKSPIPVRLFIGDMSDTDAILSGLTR